MQTLGRLPYHPTITTFHPFTFLSNAPPTIIIKFAEIIFTWAFTLSSLIPSAGHLAQYFKARWKVNVMSRSILSAGIGTRFLLADVTCNEHSSQMSEATRNDFSFPFFKERVRLWSHIPAGGIRGLVPRKRIGHVSSGCTSWWSEITRATDKK